MASSVTDVAGSTEARNGALGAAHFTMTIDGHAAPTAATLAVLNPATNRTYAEAPDCRKAQLDSAMAAAAKAFRTWRNDEAGRRAALRRAAEVLVSSADELARVLTSEQGKPLANARREVLAASAWFRYYAGLEIPREVIQDDEAAFVEVLRKPLGVVAAITPWNFPLLLATWKIAPALLAGNTMVLKPSPFTPLTTLKVGELLRDVFPAGVLNVVSSGDELGAWMTSHPVPRKISFTGSVETGKKVAAAAAPDLKRTTLELGGNDPAILLDDIDPTAVAERVFASAFNNNGQVCSAIKRVYVPEALYESVVDALAERARATKVGDGMAAETQLGRSTTAPSSSVYPSSWPMR